jgi:cellulose synthase operon protein C
MKGSMRGLKLFLVVPVMLALTACGARLTAEERMEVARDSLAGGDAPAAMIHLRNVLQADPSNVEARVLLAEASFKSGDFDSAAKEYLRAVDLGADVDNFRVALVESLVRVGGLAEALRLTDPATAGDGAEVRYWRALALGRTGELEEARRLLEGLRSSPDMAGHAQVGLARLALAAQRPAEAVALLDALGDSMAGDVDYWEVRAFASLQTGEPATAIEAFRQAGKIVVDPLGTRRFMFAAGEAEAMLSAGRLEEARALATELLRSAERHPVANYLMSRVELQAGNAEQALAYAQAILAVQPEASVGHLMAGAASLSLGQAVQAERHLEQAIASDPGNLQARKLLAQTRLGLQSPERALEALGPALGDGSDASVAALAGVANVRSGDTEAAIEIFRRQLEQDPGDEEARAMLAVSLMSAGRTDDALAELAKVKSGEGVVRQRADLIAIAAHLQSGDLAEARGLASQLAAANPADAEVHSTLGALFQGAGQSDEAAVWLEEALKIAPANNAAAYNLGRISAERGQVARAEQLFDGILERDPGNGPALSARAQLDWAHGDRDAAIARLERARSANSADAHSRFLLAQYLVGSGKAAQAVSVAEELVKIAPGVGASMDSLGLALLESGRPADALLQFERARQLEPANARYLLNTARAHAALGQLEPARSQLVNALALEPEDPMMLALLVDLERRAGKADAAAQALARLERASPPDDPRVALIRGQVLLLQERYADAEQAFGDALRLGMGSRAVIGQFETRRRGALADPTAPLRAWLEREPADPVVLRVLGDYYIGANDHPAAIGQYEKLAKVMPDNAMVLNNLAWLYGEAEDPRGLEFARRAHELAPDNPMIADTLGWILHLRGDNAQARRLLGAAVDGAPQASDLRYRYAVVLAASGDRAGATREARTVLADTGAANYHEPAQKLLSQLEKGE